MDTRKKALLTNNAAMFLYGLSAVLIGPTLPGIVSDFDLSLSAAGLIGSLQSAGGFAGALVALRLADRVSRPAAMLVSFALVGVSLLGIGISPSYAILLLAFAASGFFVRLLDVLLNAHTGDLVHGDSGRGLSTLHMFFSIGAFAGPLAARVIMRAGLSWTQVFLVVGAGYALALVGSASWLRSYVSTGRRPVRQTDPDRSARDPSGDHGAGPTSGPSPAIVVGVLGGLLFFYAIHQIGITAWLPYFLEAARGASPDLASAGLSMYWIGIIAGRFLASRSVRRLGAPSLLCGGAFASAAASIAVVLVPSPGISSGFAALAGVTSGATIPLAYAVGFSLVPERTGAVTAVMSMIMLAGRLLGPLAVGAAADRWTIVAAMMIPALVLLAAGGLAMVVLRMRRPARRRELPRYFT